MSEGQLLRTGTGKNTGFTLIELIFIITALIVLVLVATMLIPVGAPRLGEVRAGVCANNMKQALIITSLYAAENQGYIMPAGQLGSVESSGYMGDGPRNMIGTLQQTKAPINIGALYEYFDITSDAALCPAQLEEPFANSNGNTAHSNYMTADWSNDFYKYDKNWQNLRSGWMRQTWSKETGAADELEGRGLDSEWAPDKTRLKFSVLPSGSLLLADYFDSNEHIIQTHKTFLNVGMISGNVYKIPYNKKEWPFNKLERPDLPTSCIKECWDYLETKASAADRSNAR